MFELIGDILEFVESFQDEKKYKSIRMLSSKPTCAPKTCFDSLYNDYVTEFALKLLMPQFLKVDSVEIIDFKTVQTSEGPIFPTNLTCSCNFFCKYNLPCCHMIALEKFNERDVFLKSAIAMRWTKKYNTPAELHPNRKSIAVHQATPSKQKNMSFDQKFRKVDSLLKKASSVIAEFGMKEFEEKVEIVKHFVENIVNNKPFMIVDIVPAVVDDVVLSTDPLVLPNDDVVVSNDAVILPNDDVVLTNDDVVLPTDDVVVSIDPVVDSVDAQVHSSVAVQDDVVLTNDAVILPNDDVVLATEAAVSPNDDIVLPSVVLTGASSVSPGASVILPNVDVVLPNEDVVLPDAPVILQNDDVLPIVLTNDDDDDFTSLSWPTKATRKRGRPKGAHTTAIGLPTKKMRSEKTLPFFKKNSTEKKEIILKNLMKPESLSKCFFIEEDLLAYSQISMKLTDENVNITIIRKQVSPSCWSKINEIIKKKEEEGRWECKKCTDDLSKSSSICCDSCLDWFHMRCLQLRNTPKTRFYFCYSCKS